MMCQHVSVPLLKVCVVTGCDFFPVLPLPSVSIEEESCIENFIGDVKCQGTAWDSIAE